MVIATTADAVACYSKMDDLCWATVCKTVRPMLSDSRPVLSVCLSVTLVHCGQTVGRIKMKLDMQVGLGHGHTVLDGDPAPHGKGHSNPHIRNLQAHGFACVSIIRGPCL